MNQTVELELSSISSSSTGSSGNNKIMYAIGDKPFSATCDYSDNCNYTCRPNKNLTDEKDIKLDTYFRFIKINIQFMIFNINIY